MKQREQESSRGQDQSHQSKDLENKLREVDQVITAFAQDTESLKFSNDALMERNFDLKQELQSLKDHSDLLSNQNKELQHELDSFVETDDLVKRNLDRKDKVYNIRYKVDEVIKKSMNDLHNKSPARFRSPHPPADDQPSYKPQQQPPQQQSYQQYHPMRFMP